jgi:hypothetical protein
MTPERRLERRRNNETHVKTSARNARNTADWDDKNVNDLQSRRQFPLDLEVRD